MPSSDHIVLTGLKIRCIIGIFEWERKRKQDVVIDLKIPCDIRKAARRDNIAGTVDYKKIAKAVIGYVEKSRFQLIETLAERLAAFLFQNFRLAEFELAVSKPGAIRGSQNVGVQIHRVFPSEDPAERFYLGLGSNINPRQNLEMALTEMEKKYPLRGLSHVYETSPVGYVRQAPFWNMAVAVECGESAGTLRKWIRALEKKAGRRPSLNAFGPRALDIDILLRGNSLQKKRNFSLPHPDIETKAFVLFPLLEISPNLVHPALGKPLVELAAQFKDPTQKIRQMPSNTFSQFPPQGLQ